MLKEATEVTTERLLCQIAGYDPEWLKRRKEYLIRYASRLRLMLTQERVECGRAVKLLKSPQDADFLTGLWSPKWIERRLAIVELATKKIDDALQ